MFPGFRAGQRSGCFVLVCVVGLAIPPVVLGGNCGSGLIEDCHGNCAPDQWVGDGFCDDGTFTYDGVPIFFNCAQFDCDGGDCDPAQNPECGGGDCLTGEILDCIGNCCPNYWVGDGFCDDGAFSYNGVPIYLNCDLFNCDGGDCDPAQNPNCSGEPELPEMLGASPPDGAIDARQPSTLTCSTMFGWDSVQILCSGNPSEVVAAHFTVTVEPADVSPPIITSLIPAGNSVVLELNGPIPPGHWTIFTYTPTGSNWSTRLGSLPSDVNGDGTSSPLDVLALIDFLNGVGPSLNPWQSDLDRSGAANSQDILRVIDLLNGAECFDSWNGAALP